MTRPAAKLKVALTREGDADPAEQRQPEGRRAQGRRDRERHGVTGRLGDRIRDRHAGDRDRSDRP